MDYLEKLQGMTRDELLDHVEAIWRGELTVTDLERDQLKKEILLRKATALGDYVIFYAILLSLVEITRQAQASADPEKKLTTAQLMGAALVLWLYIELPKPERPIDYDLMWVTKGDEKVCPICAPLNGQILGENISYIFSTHPGCRCKTVRIPKEVRAVMDKVRILEAGAVRALSEGQKRILEVLAAPFGSQTRKDKLGQFLSPNTDFMLGVGDRRPLLYFHGFSPRGRSMKQPPSIGVATATKLDDNGLWMRAELDDSELSDRTWAAALEGNARASTGSVNYLERHDEQTGEVYCWPIAELSVFDAGDERVPVSDDAVVLPLRALFEESGIDYTFEAGEDKKDDKPKRRTKEQAMDDIKKAVKEALAAEKAAEQAKLEEREAIRAEVKKELEAKPEYRATFNVNKHTKDKGLPEGELETYNFMADLIQDAKLVASGGVPRNAMRVTTYLEESEADEIGPMVPDDMANKIHALKGKYSLIDRCGIRKYYTDKLTFNIPTEVTAFTTPATVAEAAAYVEILPEFVANSAVMLKKGFKVRVTEEALEDQNLFQQWLTQASAKAFALAENLTLHTLLDATAGTAIGTTDVITDAEMIATYFRLAQEYRDNACWIMNDATLAYVRAMLVATPRAYGEFGFRPYSMGEAGEALFNKPVFTNSNWVALIGGATGNEGITFWNPNEALAWVERRGMSIFVDPYTERASAGAINFLPSMRFNGVIVNGAAETSLDLLS